MAKAAATKSTKERSSQREKASVRQPALRPSTSVSEQSVLNLQQKVGNRAVNKLLGARHENGEHSNMKQRKEPRPGIAKATPPEPRSPGELLLRAGESAGTVLDDSVRLPMQQSLGANLGNVRVHSDPAAEAAAESIGARAYTIGSNIFLGRAAHGLGNAERSRLLAHEAVHTVQQGGQPVALQGKMDVSRPRDRAEIEADSISRTVTSSVNSPASPALGLRNQLRSMPIPAHTVSRIASPLIQRDLKSDYPVKEGNFRLDLTTESHPNDKSGMSGTIKFKANDKAPDAAQIRLLQVARDEDLSTGKEYVWTGDEAARNKVMSPGGTGNAEPGFFVDVVHKNRTPRVKGDAPVSPYYIDDYLAFKDPNNKDGSKKGKAINEASLWDYPGSAGKRRFSFETVAKDPTSGHVFGTVMWGFTLSDPAKGTVDNERAVGRWVTLKSTDLAIAAFDKYYKNPGTPGAP